jgi:hypothetical protein
VFPQYFRVINDRQARPESRRPRCRALAGNVGYRDRGVNINLVRARFDYFEGERDPIN